jgi:hypothetical protein
MENMKEIADNPIIKKPENLPQELDRQRVLAVSNNVFNTVDIVKEQGEKSCALKQSAQIEEIKGTEKAKVRRGGNLSKSSVIGLVREIGVNVSQM